MVLLLPHTEGGFGVTFNDVNDVTKDSTFYTTTSRFVARLGDFSQERQVLWFPKDDHPYDLVVIVPVSAPP